MSNNLIGATLATFTVTLSAAVTESVDVAWSTRDGTAKAGTDYEAANGVVTFLPGETAKQVQVTVYGQEGLTAPDKNFFIELSPPTNAVLGVTFIEVVITIDEEDGVAVLSLVVPQGKRGLKGDPGLSAYEHAVLMGYEGTVEQWMQDEASASAAAARAEGFAADAAESALVSNQKATEVVQLGDAKIAAVTATGNEKVAELTDIAATVTAMTDGKWYFKTEALLLANKPQYNTAAKALDTKKVWFWETSDGGVTGTWADTGLSELDLAKADATAKANAAEANANLRTGIIFDFYSLFVETQFVETDKNLRIIRSIKKGGVDSTVIEAKDYADQKSKDATKEVGIIIDFHSYFDSTQFVEVDKEFRVVREIKKGYKPDGSGGSGGDGSAVIVLDFYSNFKDKSSALVVISNNNKVLLKMASDGSEIFNANNLKNNVAVDATHIEHTFLKKRLAEHPIAAKFNYHRSNDGTVANFPSLIQVYEMYDELMSRHSDSMTKITLGTDATGLPIYCYIIKPKPYLAVGFSEEELKHPKVVISGAVHGNERPAQVGCAVFTAQLLDEHMKRERYATLRHACEFHIIPAINPWGANNFNRVNSNGVDLNRDFGDGLFTQAESQLMRDYVLSLDNVMLFLDMHQSQSPDYLLWLGATRPKSRELTKAFGVESLKYFYANVRPEATTQYSFQMAVNGDNTMCQYFSNQGIESILIESPVSHEAIGDATVVRDFVTETYVIAINEFYQNFKQTNANAAI